MRVLVLEDEPLIQMAVTMLLEEAGHRVSTAETAEGAEEIARLDVIDVAIRRLRAKIDDPFENKLIHTLRGVGYVIEERS